MRSSEELWKRYRKQAETTIHGHPACAKRLTDKSGFRPIDTDEELPAASPPTRSASRAATRPRSTCRATERWCSATRSPSGMGRLVVWAADKVDAKVERFYRERFNPTLEPLLELGVENVLVTHGQPVMGGGTGALRRALKAKPWYHHG